MNLRLRRKDFLPHQWEFLTSENPIKALVSGFGGGKTHVFLRETLLNHLFMRNRRGKSNGWIVYPTYALAEELFCEPFQELLRKYRIRFDYKATRLRFESKYGVIRVYQLQTPARMVGSELTYIGFDEFDIGSYKNCEIAYQKAIGRLRGCENARLYIVTTPEGFHYTYKLFKEEGAAKHLIQAKTTDNPHLPASYIHYLRSQYDENLLRRYMNGEFVNLNTAQAYYNFERERHVKEVECTYAPEYYVGMDFNIDPMTAVVGVFRDDRYEVLNEFWLKNSNTERMCKVISQDFDPNRIVVYPDMTGIKRSTSAAVGLTDIKILKSNGFRVKATRNPLVRDRINAVNNALAKGKLLIHPRCRHLIRDLEQVSRDKHGELDKSSPDLTHISDAMGYAVWNLFPIVSQPDWRTSA